MDNGEILYSMVNDTCVIKMNGNVGFKISPAFDQFLDKLVTDASVDKFVVDLTDATHIDSTNLGLLIKLYRSSRIKANTPTLVSSQNHINNLLLSIGLDQLFTIVDTTEHTQSNLENIPDMDDAGEKVAKVMLKAHQELAQLNATNKELFQDVVKYLEGNIRHENNFKIS